VSSLTRAALGGVAWNWAGSAVLVVAQIASTAATARLIAPGEFGAYASAQALAGLAGYFTMNAIGSGLLRRAELKGDAVGTATVLTVAIGLGVGTIVWFAAGLWAQAWHVPGAAPLVRVLAVTLVFTSAATVPLALIRRALRFGAAAGAETGTQVLGLALSVALAVVLHSALALAIGQAVAAGSLLVAALVLARRDLALRFVRAEARELLTFSGQVSMLNLGAFVANTAPAWFAARIYGGATLGLYSRASLVVNLPLNYLSTGVTKILFPLYGHVRDDVRRTRTLVSEGLVLSTGFVWPLLALLAGSSTLVVRLLLGERWHDAATLVALCALIGCGAFPAGLLTNAAEAFGWMRIVAVRRLVFLAGVAAGLAVGYVTDVRLVWLLAGIALAQAIGYVITLVPFVRRGILSGRAVLASQSVHAAAALGAYLVTASTAAAVANAPLGVQVVCVFGVCLLVCAVLLLSRSWFPAGRILGARLERVAPAGFGARFLRVGAAAR